MRAILDGSWTRHSGRNDGTARSRCPGQRSLHDPELGGRAVLHDDKRPLIKADPAAPVVLDHLDLAHSKAHGPARVGVHGELVRVCRGLALDSKALRPISRGHVVAERPAGCELLVSMVCRFALPIFDMEIEIAG